MAAKLAKKTTTAKKPAKKAAKDAGEKKKFEVAAKAGLLTYNDCKWETVEDIKQHHKELSEKTKHTLVFSSVCEMETRKHGHTMYHSEDRVNVDLQFFQTSKSGPVGDFQPNRGKNIPQGHYYCCCPYKTSFLFGFADEPVKAQANWLMNLWKKDKVEKIIKALATEKLLTPQLQLQISTNNNYREQIRIQEELEARDLRLQNTMCKFQPNDLVEEWKKTFLVETRRYKFLVLCGPSMMRKTEFAKSLFPNPFLHKDKVDWDGYSWKDHGCVIFDDINQCGGSVEHIWKYVRTNKVLFQSSSVVPVNTSATNCYKRDVCLVQKPIIICTNDGLLDKYVTAEYQEWIKSNCCWIKVEKPIPFLSPFSNTQPDWPEPMDED